MLPADVMLSFFGAALLLGMSPGPDILFVLTQSALYGWRSGVVTTLGLVTGLCVHTTAVAFGVAALFQTSAVAFHLLQLAGAGYLLWLAWGAFRAGALRADLASDPAAHVPGLGALYRRGILMNVTNPKVSLFFLAFLPQFCDPARGSVSVQVLVLGLLFMLATVLVFCAVAFLGGRLAMWFNRCPWWQRGLQRLAACVFVGLAVALLCAGAP